MWSTVTAALLWLAKDMFNGVRRPGLRAVDAVALSRTEEVLPVMSVNPSSLMVVEPGSRGNGVELAGGEPSDGEPSEGEPSDGDAEGDAEGDADGDEGSGVPPGRVPPGLLDAPGSAEIPANNDEKLLTATTVSAAVPPRPISAMRANFFRDHPANFFPINLRRVTPPGESVTSGMFPPFSHKYFAY